MILYHFQNQIITSQAIETELRPHIRSNSVIYVEFDVTTFGTLANTNLTKHEFLGEIFRIFVRLAGDDGVVITPSFTYSWGSTKPEKVFDILETRSNISAMGEYARKQDFCTRTLDPMFSCMVAGKRKTEFCHVNNNSFGQGSIYDKMMNENAYLINFGLNRYDPTFVHYVEQSFDETIDKYPFRSLIEFTGEVIDFNKKRYYAEHKSFMRKLGGNYLFADEKLIKSLRERDALTTMKIGGGLVYLSDCHSVYSAGMEGLRNDIRFFTSGA